MTQNSYRYTRTLILISTYYESRYGAGYARPLGGFAYFRNDFNLDSSRTFQTLAIRDLVGKRLVDVSEPSSAESFAEDRKTALTITSGAAVRIEKHLEETSIHLPPIWSDDDGDRIGPSPDELANMFDIDAFEADLGLNE